MKMRKNNIGFGILSLALALALPLNANADEGQTLTSPETLDQGPKTQVEANTKPIEDNEIIQTPFRQRLCHIIYLKRRREDKQSHKKRIYIGNLYKYGVSIVFPWSLNYFSILSRMKLPKKISTS